MRFCPQKRATDPDGNIPFAFTEALCIGLLIDVNDGLELEIEPFGDELGEIHDDATDFPIRSARCNDWTTRLHGDS